MSRSAPIDRNQVVARLGTPDLTEGSLNEPREREEDGVRFNEKWIYHELLDDPSGAPMRVIYWHRYDLMATMVRNDAVSAWRPDTSLSDELKSRSDRLAPLDLANNPPLQPRSRYRAVSEFEGPPDLGGHVQPREPQK